MKHVSLLLCLLAFCPYLFAHKYTQKQPQVNFSQIINLEKNPQFVTFGIINSVVYIAVSTASNVVFTKNKYDLNEIDLFIKNSSVLEFVFANLLSSVGDFLVVILPTTFINVFLERISDYCFEDNATTNLIAVYLSRTSSSCVISYYYLTLNEPLRDLLSTSFFLIGVNTYIDHGVIATLLYITLSTFVAHLRLRCIGW